MEMNRRSFLKSVFAIYVFPTFNKVSKYISAPNKQMPEVKPESIVVYRWDKSRMWCCITIDDVHYPGLTINEVLGFDIHQWCDYEMGTLVKYPNMCENSIYNDFTVIFPYPEYKINNNLSFTVNKENKDVSIGFLVEGDG